MKQTMIEITYNEAQRLKKKTAHYAKAAAPIAVPMALLLMPTVSHAITAPAAATFAYDLYDVAVNKIIKGPVGFVGGMITVIISAMNITKNWMLAGGGILGGTALIKAPGITASMGLTL